MTLIAFVSRVVTNSVGTLELRSLIEPIRRLLSRLGGYYVEGRADDVDFENQLVEVTGIHDSEGRKFYGIHRSVINLLSSNLFFCPAN